MGSFKIFRITGETAEALPARTAAVEREIHALMERHMTCFFGIRFVAHEYSTGSVHRGRIDSLGLDENFCPVILEYKRKINENVINQGLYYLDWLLDHRAEFTLLVRDRYGRDAADAIQWAGTRVLCIAADFTKFDEHAVAQIRRNIELIKYAYFGADLLCLEWVNPVQEEGKRSLPEPALEAAFAENDTHAAPGSAATREALYKDLSEFIFSLGSDITCKELKVYIAFRRLKNFVCVEPKRNWLKLYLPLSPDSVALEEGFSRDMRNRGHWGTGDLELAIRGPGDMEKAKPLIARAYEEN